MIQVDWLNSMHASYDTSRLVELYIKIDVIFLLARTRSITFLITSQ
jgi:hypothetical protein